MATPTLTPPTTGQLLAAPGAFLNPNSGISYTNTNVSQQATPGTQGSTPNNSAPGSAGNPPTAGGAASPVAVVTSQPATDNYNSIQSQYTNTIAPNIQNATATTTAANSLPVIPGYNVSATQTGNKGETKATNNATGQTYYITPQEPPVTASQVSSILSGGNTGTTSTTGQPQSPSDIATAQTGINPGQESANYEANVQGATDQLTQAQATYQNTINSIMSGSFPLSTAEQSLVDATNGAFQQMNAQAQLKAAALSSETGGVSNKVNAMAGEMTNITSEQAAAVAKLQVGFEQQDYQMVTDAYNSFKDLETARMTALTDTHNAIMSTYNTALDAAQKQQSAQVQAAQFAQTEQDNQEKIQISAAQTKIDAANAQTNAENANTNAENANTNAAAEGLRAATFSAEYGGFLDGNGQPIAGMTPSDIPGYTTLTNGIPVIVNTNGNYKTSNLGGVSVISPQDAVIVNGASQALTLINKLQEEGGAVDANDAKALDGILSTLTKNPQFSSLGNSYVPDVMNFMGQMNGGGTSGNLDRIRTGLINGLGTLIPNYHIPSSGQVFTDQTDAQNYYSSIGQPEIWNNAITQLQSQGIEQPTAGQVLQVINAN